MCIILSMGILSVLRSFITFILQSRPYFLIKSEMTAIDLVNLGHTLTDSRNDKLIFILICDISTLYAPAIKK